VTTIEQFAAGFDEDPGYLDFASVEVIQGDRAWPGMPIIRSPETRGKRAQARRRADDG